LGVKDRTHGAENHCEVSTLTEHTPAQTRRMLAPLNAILAAMSARVHMRRSGQARRRLRVFDGGAVIAVAVSFATLGASDYRLTALLAASAVFLKGFAIGGRRWVSERPEGLMQRGWAHRWARLGRIAPRG